MEESRTINSIRNIKTGAFVQIVNKLMAFIVRTVFIRVLNSDYLGVNGLFTNVLTILSFAELGVGIAIIFNMYKPVAEHNHNKINALMQLYKKSYNIIGIVVFILGLCVIPFMGLIVKDAPDIKESIVLIYVLFLTNVSISYFFTYKKSIISAHQKQSIINNFDSIIYFVKSILEIVFLVVTRNFIVYLCIEILSTLCENIILSIKADKMYPYLKDKNTEKLSKNEKNEIFGNVKSLIIYKFGGVIMNGTDNILISSLVNVGTVGYCSNYVLIIGAIKSVIVSALGGITASVGNLNAVGDRKQKERVFYIITFTNYIVYSFCAVAFIVLLNPFIKTWLGEQYVLHQAVPISLAISFLIEGLRNPGYTYRTTMGLFQKGKLTPYIGAVTNVFFSIILCKMIGVAGIFFATSIAQLFSYVWIDPYLIYKYEFNTSVVKYFKKFGIYILSFTAIAVISTTLANITPGTGIVEILIKAIIAMVVPNAINLAIFWKTDEFKYLKDKFFEPVYAKLKKLNKK